MPKFSPGDRVKVRTDLKYDQCIHMEDNPGNIFIEDSHLAFVGQEVTIQDIYYWNGGDCWCYIVEENPDGFWTDGCFDDEAVSSNPMAEVSQDDLMEVLSI